MDVKQEKSPTQYPAQYPVQHNVNGLNINVDLEELPIRIDDCDTLPKLFQKRCKELGERTAHREKELGIWLSHSWNDFYNRSRLIGCGLLSLGMQRGEVVSVLSEDNKEWIYIDLAVQSVGGICSGIYTTDSASQLDYLVNDSDSRFLFVENDEQLDKYLETRDSLTCLTKTIVLDREGLHDFSDPDVLFLDDLYDLGRQFLKQNDGRFEAEIAATQQKCCASLTPTKMLGS